ncbi:zinc-binding dehydrogenase [Streptomyces sp. NPDC088258]|uniref:zinc-binding dehydrogenase n=1 Tax=Streptomyces sp. NPDC088258 TaxID=3365849 RepID=UPI00382B1695
MKSSDCRHFRHATASAKIRPAARRRGVGYRYLFMHPSGADLEVLAGLVDKGILKIFTDCVFPFEQIADAFAYLEQVTLRARSSSRCSDPVTTSRWIQAE